jgi:hypothetical protein
MSVGKGTGIPNVSVGKGTVVQVADGAGDSDPPIVGDPPGVSDGASEGIAEGVSEGISDGIADGISDGVADGVADGIADGVGDAVAHGSPAGPPGAGVSVMDGSGGSAVFHGSGVVVSATLARSPAPTVCASAPAWCTTPAARTARKLAAPTATGMRRRRRALPGRVPGRVPGRLSSLADIWVNPP